MKLSDFFSRGMVEDRPDSPKMQPVAVVPVRSEEEIIAEIHASFDSAQDDLLRQAEKILSENVIPESQRAKAEALRRLGFSATVDVQKLNEIDRATDKSRRLARDIVYYKQKYPFLKFLTIQELDKICTKYGLLHAQVYYYNGDVPDKNLKEIEDAQRLEGSDYPNAGRPARFVNQKTGEVRKFNYEWEIYVDQPKIVDAVDSKEDWQYSKDQDKDNYNYPFPVTTQPLSIAAPKAMFNIQGLTQVGNQLTLVNKDPIVFRYVRGGIQVLSKWGLEASDPSLVLPINN